MFARLQMSARLLRRSGYRYARMSMVRPPFWLVANGRKCRVAAGHESGAVTCYAEVAVRDCYGLFSYARRAQPTVIVDIGANLGMFSKLCSMLFPEAVIYAYEPNPGAVAWLRQNAEGTRIQVLPVAVSETSGATQLDTTSDSTIGRTTASGNWTVECVAASTVADGRPIDLLKLDCEGGEWSILRDGSLLARTQECRLEYHLFDVHTEEEIRTLIEQAGHRIFSWTRMDGGFGVIHSGRRLQTAARNRLY